MNREICVTSMNREICVSAFWKKKTRPREREAQWLFSFVLFYFLGKNVHKLPFSEKKKSDFNSTI